MLKKTIDNRLHSESTAGRTALVNHMPGGGDWSGLPGHLCEVCGRSSENVGPRRGFDYVNDYCGGCCEISSDDDGHNKEGCCRSCKKYITFRS